MSNSKKYHVSLDDISRWDDAVSRIPGIIEMLKLLYDREFENNIIPANTLFDIFSDTIIEVGTEGIPFDNITVGAIDLDGPFDHLVVITNIGPVVGGNYYTGFRVNGVVIGDASDLDPIDNIVVGSSTITGPFKRVKANANIFIISNI